MAKYTFHKFTENIASVVKVATNTSTIASHTLVTIDPTTFAVTSKNSDIPVAGDFLVWRPYPQYDVYGDRYGKTKTPIATSVGELYGFKLKVGDELIVEDAGSTGLTVGSVVEIGFPEPKGGDV